ncbi:uncharacterized protein B4U79_19026, partial [Dinothrombium tinctorium]
MASLLEEIKNKKINFLKTLFACLIFFSEGFIESMYGATLLDLKGLLGASVYVMSNFLSLRAIGFIIGCIVCGFVPKDSNKEVQLLIAILAQATFLSVIPYIRNFWIFYMTAAFVGFILGFVETCVNIYIASLWSDATKMFLQLGATFYGLGLGSAPIIAEPFLSEEID